MKKRVLTMLLAVVIAVGLFPMVASAASGAQKVVDMAFKYYGQKATASTFGFSADWCGSFLYYIANEAGEGAAMGGSDYTMRYVPRSMDWFITNGAKVGYFYDALPNNTEAHLTGSQRMNKSDYIPQLGDVIYFDWDGYGNGGLYHVEIVTHIDGRGISTVGGNTGSDDWRYSSVNARWSIIDNSPNIVAFARPNYSGAEKPAETTSPSTPAGGGTTKTQYRYHRYEDNNGEYAVCAYWGNVTYNTTMHIAYSDWLDSPLPEVKQGYVNYLEHPNQGAACANAGCLSSDPFEVHRHVDASGKVWYYEETRTVAVETTPTPTPTPEPVPNCDKGHTWGGWSVVKEATCEEEGSQERVCELCGETEAKVIAALGHDYRVKQETDTSILKVCANCGDSVLEEKEPAVVDNSDIGNFTAKNHYSDGLFRDVKSGDWFSSNVATAYSMGLMNGTGSGSFSPGNNMTLAEVVTLAARIHRIYYTGSDSFPSYDGGNWYDPYVNYARDNGIIDANYAYSRPATREEVVHILVRALPEDELENTAGRVSFADSGEITYMADVRLLSGAGVINGIQEGGVTYFKPLSPITRAEVAAVVGRMVQPSTRVGK